MPTKDLVQITGWTNPRLRLKERMRRIKEYDHRMTESRIVEEAVMSYLPQLEFRLAPPLPTDERTPAEPRTA
jgi:hypothetical protein